MAKVINMRKANIPGRGFVGFSWTVLFFGFLVPLFRGDWKWTAIMLACSLLTVGLANIIFAFTYNKAYTRSMLVEQGFVPADEDARRRLLKKGLLIE